MRLYSIILLLTPSLPSSRYKAMTDTRTKILDVAEELIQSVGVNAMSYKHISEAVGIRKASIHHHFPKKDDLVDELLHKCQNSYGANYRSIVEGKGTAPEKLKNLAGVFRNGLRSEKLCMVGSISTDKNTLQDSSCKILENTIEKTVKIFSTVFEQGREEKSLVFVGEPGDAAYSFFAFLVGTQIVARANGGEEMFDRAAKVFIEALLA